MQNKDIKGYYSWQGMKNRCYNTNSQDYSLYGARGINVCDEWKDSFETFVSDMGEKPEGMSLDRIDVNGDYTPKNCRWADDVTQANNKRFNIIITYMGETKPLGIWARELGVSLGVLYRRLNSGWPIDRLFKKVDGAKTHRNSRTMGTQKTALLTDPDGDELIVGNLTKFCKSMGFDLSHFCKAINGKRKHYKGWTGVYVK